MQITIENKETLINNIKSYLREDFLNTLKESDLDEYEIDANLVLSRKKIEKDAENIATLLYRVYGLE